MPRYTRSRLGCASSLSCERPFSCRLLLLLPFLSFQLSVFRLQFRYQPALKIETRKLALLFLTGRLLLSNRGATRTFARTRIGVRALAANGQPTTMAQSAICADVHQTLDVHLNALAK